MIPMNFCYLNTENIYPQDRHLIDGLRQLNHKVTELHEKGGLRGAWSLAKKLKEIDLKDTSIIVGFTSPLFVLSAFVRNPRKIIFNAVLSQYEANIISRGEHSPFSFPAIKWWLIDFVSFHLSWKILLESDAQVDFIHRRFFVSKRKLIRSFSGLDESQFFFDPAIPKKPHFTVLFRGRFLPESGILTVIETAKKLENAEVDFLVIGHGFLYREVNALLAKLSPKNLTMMTERLPFETLRPLMLSCHISLGQLATHPRLDRTLPCKLFETLALKLPYLTGRNKAVFEILEENVTCFAVQPGNSDDLAQKILALKNDPSLCEKVASAGYALYQQKLTSKILTADVLGKCFSEKTKILIP